MTLELDGVGERSLYALLTDHASVRMVRDDRAALAGTPPVATHVVDLPLATLYRALTAATGTRLVAGSDGAWRFQPSSDCPLAAPPPPADATAPPALQSVLVRAESNHHAEATEAYPLEEFHPRGVIRVAGARVALLETEDGRTWGIRRGSHLGRDFGQALSVDDDRLTVQEWFQNPFGFWTERHVAIDLAGGPLR